MIQSIKCIFFWTLVEKKIWDLHNNWCILQYYILIKTPLNYLQNWSPLICITLYFKFPGILHVFLPPSSYPPILNVFIPHPCQRWRRPGPHNCWPPLSYRSFRALSSAQRAWWAPKEIPSWTLCTNGACPPPGYHPGWSRGHPFSLQMIGTFVQKPVESCW